MTLIVINADYDDIVKYEAWCKEFLRNLDWHFGFAYSTIHFANSVDAVIFKLKFNI